MLNSTVPLSTSLSRRGVIAAGAAALAGAALPMPAAAAPFSPEFLEYRRCLQAHIDASDGTPEPPFGTPEYFANQALSDAACERRYEACLVIQNRPVRSWQDFRELALVVRYQLWDQMPDGTWDRHSGNDELEEALQAATWQLIEGGVHV